MIKLWENFNSNTYYVVKYKDGRFLRLLFVTKHHPFSEVTLVDSGFPCWKTEEEAQDYLETGNEVKYSYDSIDLDINDFEIVKIII